MVMNATIRLPGLGAQATIITDRWGIPHIRAAGLHDLFFAQGFTAARDRLWQIDLWRKRGLGRLAASFGPGFLAQDRAARLFLYRGDMTAEWEAYAPDAEAICTAFAAGINAFVAWTEDDAARLPPEFTLTDTRPERWEPADVVRIRTHGLVRNAASELLRTIVAGQGIDDALRKRPDPAVPATSPPDLHGLAPEALRTYQLATAPVSFAPARLRATLTDAERWSDVSDAGEVIELEGSNNWAVSPGRTATGRPILASDPHRAHAIPSLRALVHLSMPGWDAIGYGESSSPGICMGHNGTAAWGLTIWPGDQEDVYVYEADGNRYRHNGAWEEMIRVDEVFDVRGAAPQTHVLRFTRHGPVLASNGASSELAAGNGAAVAVRSVWSLPGAAGYLASLAGMRARSLSEFRTAMDRWVAPTCNQAYADTSGTVARITCGFVPRRTWTGLLPVPGDGSHEWDGVRLSGDLPWEADPARGFVWSANENNLPADWDHAAAPVGFEWADPYRADRIHAVLAADASHTVAVSQALQTDVFSAPALRLAALAPGGAFRGWDGCLRVDTREAALCELWWARHLKPALLAALVPDAAARRRMLPGDTGALLDALDVLPERDRVLRDTFAAAEAECAERMGPDRTAWRWGTLHHAQFTHALSRAAGHAGWDAGPVALGGSAATPMAAGYRPGDFRLLAGASVRMVVDVGDWDRSVCINTPGQSGDPRSPHYKDLVEPWSRGEYVPMLYTEAAVRDAAEEVLTLQPG